MKYCKLKRNLLKIPAGGRMISWLIIKGAGVESGTTKQRSSAPTTGPRHEGLCERLGSLSTCVFETRTATGREHFECWTVLSPRILYYSNGEKILSNVNVIVRRQVKSKNRSLPVPVSKTRVLKLPN